MPHVSGITGVSVLWGLGAVTQHAALEVYPCPCVCPFPSSLGLADAPVHAHTALYPRIHRGHVAHPPALATVVNAAAKPGAHISRARLCSQLWGGVPGSGTARSRESKFNSLSSRHIVFQSGCARSRCHRQCAGSTLPPSVRRDRVPAFPPRVSQQTGDHSADGPHSGLGDRGVSHAVQLQTCPSSVPTDLWGQLFLGRVPPHACAR